MKIKNKLKCRKGFTLVELLVVLVIIAILAAAIVPSMLGFIDKAKSEKNMSSAKLVLEAANVVLNEKYAAGDYDTVGGTFTDEEIEEVLTVADCTPDYIDEIIYMTDANGHPKITNLDVCFESYEYEYSNLSGENEWIIYQVEDISE